KRPNLRASKRRVEPVPQHTANHSAVYTAIGSCYVQLLTSRWEAAEDARYVKRHRDRTRRAGGRRARGGCERATTGRQPGRQEDEEPGGGDSRVDRRGPEDVRQVL